MALFKMVFWAIIFLTNVMTLLKISASCELMCLKNDLNEVNDSKRLLCKIV